GGGEAVTDVHGADEVARLALEVQIAHRAAHIHRGDAREDAAAPAAGTALEHHRPQALADGGAGGGRHAYTSRQGGGRSTMPHCTCALSTAVIRSAAAPECADDHLRGHHDGERFDATGLCGLSADAAP